MSTRTILVAVLALICGACAVVMVNEMNNRSNDSEVKTVPVVVADRNMPRGSMLSESSLRIDQWQPAHVPEGALSSIEEASERSTMTPIFKGEPILDNKLASKEAGRGLASMIKPGMRAFTIQTAHVSAGVGGFLLPQDKVDVLLTTTASGPDDMTGGGATTTLLQNVEVLAVAQRLDAPDTNTVDVSELKNVTLLVTPDQAAKLDLGMNKGSLHLSLRNPEDTIEANTSPATMAQLRFHQEAPNGEGSFGAALLGFATQALLTSSPEPEVVEVMKPELEEEEELDPTWRSHIYTLRGVQRGTVQVEMTR